MSDWRTKARAVIVRAAAAYDGPTEGLRAHISAAYPFGIRDYYPYKVWCQEVRRFLGQPGRSERDRLNAWNAGEPIRDTEATE